MNLEAYSERRFHVAILLCAVFYSALELVYVLRLPLVMDEFAGAAQVHAFLTGVPYRDFMPYKTVLGYYIQLPVLALVRDPWAQLISLKIWMVAVNSAAIFAAALILGRHYKKAAVIMATVLLVTMSTFLERSSALRVDMLTAVFGLFSLLFLLERRVVLSGLLAGLSFLVSQKGVYFMVAGGVATGSYWLLRNRNRNSLADLLRYSLFAIAPIGAYFAFWAVLSSPAKLYHDVVTKGGTIARSNLYDIRKFWFQTTLRNPYFWGVAVLSLGQLFALRHEIREGDPESVGEARDWYLLSYGATMFMLCLWHKQPWPYFFVILIPTAYVLIASFFSIELNRAPNLSRTVLLIFVSVGLAFPLSRVPKVIARDNRFQDYTVTAVDKILEEGESYVAGVDLLRTKAQPSKFRWLDAAQLQRLRTSDPNELIRDLRQSRVKLVVRNYRVGQLPQAVLEYLGQTYYPAFGNILLYGPVFPASSETLELEFAGEYVVGQGNGGSVEIDGRKVASGQSIQLSKGSHRLRSDRDVRLRWVPNDIRYLVDARFNTARPLFENVYTY